MTKYSLCLYFLILLIPTLSYSQSAITVSVTNTVNNGSYYLINIPVNKSVTKFDENKSYKQNLLIKDFENRIPLKAFLKRRGEGFREVDTSIVWQKNVSNSITAKNGSKTNSINYIYQIVGNRFDSNGC